MNTAQLILKGTLAVIILTAGAFKALDRRGTRQALLDFGFTPALVNPFAILLPVAELVVACALCTMGGAWWGSVGALALLLAFIAAICINLALGRKPDCHCFGQLHSAPIGWKTVVRNCVLAAMAAFIVWQGPTNQGPSLIAWLGELTAFQASLVVGFGLVAVVFAVQGWFILNLLQQNGRLVLRLDALETRLGIKAPGQPVVGLPLGSPAPAFELPTLAGGPQTLDALRSKTKPVLLVFSAPNCGPCNALLPDIAKWQREYSAKLTTAVISRGKPEANQAKVEEHDLTNLLLQKDGEVAKLYQAHGTPAAVLVRPDGTIGSPLAMGPDGIRALAAATLGLNGHAAAAPHIKVGDDMTAFKLPDLDGKEVVSSDLRGPILWLFWNPGCGYCQRMLEDVKRWERDRPAHAPKLVFISTGTAEQNRAMGLHSPVVLDPGFSVGQQFAARGTPSAVLIDEKGKVASEVAVGAQAILTLARNGHSQLTT